MPALLLVVLSLLLVACGAQPAETEPASADDGGAGAQAGDDRQDDAGDEPAADHYPVEIAHRHGTTEIAEQPERVVTVGLTDHDALLALGVTPVGITEWYGEQEDGLWPWARAALQGEAPDVVGTSTELDFEAIAALDPDVIVGLYSALTEDDYETLSQIAPTVAQPDDHVDWGVPWQELTRTVGRLMDLEDEAETEIARVEDAFAEARAEHPELEGATAAIATPAEGIYVYSPEVANVRLLGSLGLEVPDAVAELVGDADGAQLSLERVDMLDVDALVWLDGRPGEGPVAEPLYQRLDVHAEGRELFVSSMHELGGAMSFSSVLSIPLVIDELAPRLAAAVDGDPSTEVEPAMPAA